MRKCGRPLLDGPDDEESWEIAMCDCEDVFFFRKARMKKRKKVR